MSAEDYQINNLQGNGEPIFERSVAWHSHRVQVRKNGEWVHPEYLPVPSSRNEAFRIAVTCFPLGQARVVLMKFVNGELQEVVEAPQKEFLWHCIKWGKL